MKHFTLYNIVLLFFFLSTFNANAAENATQILSRCANAVNNAESFEIKFTLKTGNQSSDFEMLISHEKFKLESKDVAVWYNGVTQWTYIKSNQELSITDPTADELMECNPFAILNFYSKKYNARRLAGTGNNIEMTSKDSNSTIRKAVITIDSKTYLPTKLNVTLSNGRTMSAVISSIVRGKRQAATAFTYDKTKYPSLETIDLR